MRCRLRSVAIIVAIAAALLSICYWVYAAVRRYDEQCGAIQLLQDEAHWKLHANPGSPGWLQVFVRKDRFRQVVGIEFVMPARGRPPELNGLRGLPWLRRLSLQHSGIDNQQLKHVAQVTTIEHLDLDGNQIDDRGISYLSHLRELRSLSLISTDVRGEGLEELSILTHLADLAVSSEFISSNAVKGASQIVSLKRLRIWRVPALDDETIATLSNLRELELLDLSGSHLSGCDLLALNELPSLRRLVICYATIDRGVLGDLKKHARFFVAADGCF